MVNCLLLIFLSNYFFSFYVTSTFFFFPQKTRAKLRPSPEKRLKYLQSAKARKIFSILYHILYFIFYIMFYFLFYIIYIYILYWGRRVWRSHVNPPPPASQGQGVRNPGAESAKILADF